MSYPPGGYQPPQNPDPNNPGAYPSPPQQPGYPAQPQQGYPTQPQQPGGYPTQPQQYDPQAYPAQGFAQQQPMQPGMTPPMPPGDIQLGMVPPAPQKKRRSPLVLSIIAAVAILLVGAGSWAAVAMFNKGGPDTSTQLPGSVKAYASINLDVSADQALKLQDIAEKFPEMEKTGSPEEIVKELLSEIETEGDVKGSLTDWVGLDATMALWTDSDDTPYGLLSVASTDDAAAKDGLAEIQKKADGKEQFGYVVADGQATVAVGEADSQAAAEAAAAEAKESPLSDNDAFADVADWLGDDKVVSAWADLEAAFPVYEDLMAAELGGDPSGMMSGILEQQESMMTGQVAIAATATDYGVEVRSQTFGASEVPAGSADLLSKLGELPPSDVAGVAQLPDDLAENYGWLQDMAMGGPTNEVETALNALSGATLSVTVSGIADGTPAGQLVAETTSADNANALYDLVNSTGGDPSGATVDGSTISAASPGYVAPEGKLSGDEKFQTVMADSLSEVNLALFVDLTTLVPESEREGFEAVQAVSVVQGVEGGESAGVYRVLIG